MIGQRFGRLVVESVEKETHRGKNRNYLRTFLLTKCDCGKLHRARIDGVTSGKVQSCGCLQSDNGRWSAIKVTKHGLSKTAYYSRWMNMIRRCTNPKDLNYDRYGGRGIKVCDRWLNSFQNFLDDMGLPPFKGAELDRINNGGNYEPGNVRWATRSQNGNNKRTNVLLTYNGVTKTMKEWSIHTGIGYWAMVARRKSGWSVEEMINGK